MCCSLQHWMCFYGQACSLYRLSRPAHLVGVAVPVLFFLFRQRVEQAAGDDVLHSDQPRIRSVAVVDDTLPHFFAQMRAIVVRLHLHSSQQILCMLSSKLSSDVNRTYAANCPCEHLTLGTSAPMDNAVIGCQSQHGQSVQLLPVVGIQC